MREVKFLRQNADRWKEFEQLLENPSQSEADKLADLYVQLTDDLSYAKTYYPNSKTTAYLNELTTKVHKQVYKNKKEEKGRILRFWKKELPLLYYRHRKKLAIAFIVFIIAVGVGVISAANDAMFTRTIMGDNYVNMTLSNIHQNDPMAVYKSENSMNMFLGITVNNIKVSFIAFLFGLLAAVGTGFILMKNGIMIGAFLSLFFKYNLLSQSLSVIFIHGTLELSSIIIAGSAGLVMGSGILFPGSYRRLQAFKQSARQGLKMTFGLIPLFIAAGFLESFVTRHTDMPLALTIAIIGGSLLFVIWYFVLYPRYINNKIQQHG